MLDAAQLGVFKTATELAVHLNWRRGKVSRIENQTVASDWTITSAWRPFPDDAGLGVTTRASDIADRPTRYGCRALLTR